MTTRKTVAPATKKALVQLVPRFAGTSLWVSGCSCDGLVALLSCWECGCALSSSLLGGLWCLLFVCVGFCFLCFVVLFPVLCFLFSDERDST